MSTGRIGTNYAFCSSDQLYTTVVAGVIDAGQRKGLRNIRLHSGSRSRSLREGCGATLTSWRFNAPVLFPITCLVPLLVPFRERLSQPLALCFEEDKMLLQMSRIALHHAAQGDNAGPVMGSLARTRRLVVCEVRATIAAGRG